MSRATHLKIKIATLAAEASIIRRDERKALGHAREGLKGGIDPAYILEHFETYDDLREHRLKVVRPICRSNHIAYGFLRGRSYASMEKKTASIPNFKSIRKHAQNFFDGPWDPERWEWWLAKAKDHLSGQGDITPHQLRAA